MESFNKLFPGDLFQMLFKNLIITLKTFQKSLIIQASFLLLLFFKFRSKKLKIEMFYLPKKKAFTDLLNNYTFHNFEWLGGGGAFHWILLWRRKIQSSSILISNLDLKCKPLNFFWDHYWKWKIKKFHLIGIFIVTWLRGNV